MFKNEAFARGCKQESETETASFWGQASFLNVVDARTVARTLGNDELVND